MAAAPNLTAAATPEEFDQVVTDIDEAYRSFEARMATLEGRQDTDTERVRRIRDHADTLISNIAEIRGATSGVFELTSTSRACCKTA